MNVTDSSPTGAGQLDDSRVRDGFAGFDVRTVARDSVDIAYRIGGSGPAVVLIHGFPQTGFEWRHVAGGLVGDYQVIVPDSRGWGGSSVPEDGYEKMSMARDVDSVLSDAGVSAAHIVGHDIGLMIAYAFARQFPSKVLTLTLMDAVVPGTDDFQAKIAGGRSWHFGFHKNVELATSLISGREEIYFDWIFDNYTVAKEALGPAERRYYVEGARKPGALRAGIKSYEAFGRDGEQNAATLKAEGKLTMPVLVMGGSASLGPFAATLGAEIADNARSAVIDGAGHFIAEEKPDEVLAQLRAFFPAA